MSRGAPEQRPVPPVQPGVGGPATAQPWSLPNLRSRRPDPRPTTIESPPVSRPTPPRPNPGDIVRVRQRTWLCEDVLLGRTESEASVVRLACLQDDAAGESISVLWEHEVDAAVVATEPALSTGPVTLDDPRMFSAYLHALRWNCVTSTDKRLLQAPFRAGIDLKAYQLEPLRKALELPRVNLFIADDVGLGKTIEAGLVMQELILRQRVDRVVIIAPPAVVWQWQEEMEQRFGLPFAVYNAEYVASRRRERGWGVNPWTTHPRFIVSYALLRGASSRLKGRPGSTQHLSLLLNALGNRAERSLLIVDECHQAAPSSDSLYPIDSRTTRAVREVAARFEHRLFLSATPHNGHSQSFSALLELLDPQRFTRGVRVTARQLAPVMVRRLKRHLRDEIDGLPNRVLVDHVIEGGPDEPEVALGRMLARYEELYRAALIGLPPKEQAIRGLVCVNLHKRLLSSVAAFHRTIEVHARAAPQPTSVPASPQMTLRTLDSEATDEELDAAEDEQVRDLSVAPGGEAARLLGDMRSLAATNSGAPDGRLRELARWIKANLCPNGRWNTRRVVVFTEYDDTLRWIARLLPGLVGADAQGRIERYYGGLADKRREGLKRAFNTAPDAHPLRVLLCTDAAREGINLQAHCADLFHFDLPWNPGRIEQRNGRIDRVLQPEKEVRCHYFVVDARPEDRVLQHLVVKVEQIRHDLGSLSDVISARLAAQLDQGLRGVTPDRINTLATPDDAAVAAARELEGDGAELLRGNLETLRRQLDRSARSLAYRPEQLSDATDLGLTIATGGKGLQRAFPETTPPTWALPSLDSSWTTVLDGMREPRPDDAPPWFRPPVKPIAFRAAHTLHAEATQLHLGHPLVKRLLSRFRAQGFAAYDLSRVTVIENTRDHLRRAVAFARLSLHGHGATRLHEELVAIPALVTSDGIRPFAEEAERRAVDTLYDLLAAGPPLHTSAVARHQVEGRHRADFAALWGHLSTIAGEREAEARAMLTARGEEESVAMADLLRSQRAAIFAAFEGAMQLSLGLAIPEVEARSQFERDRRYMERRIDEIEAELSSEPASIRRQYEVVLTRLEPIGLVYLWPSS